MSRFKVVLGQLGHSYRVEIVGSDGSRQTVLGFSSEDEANQWIKLEQRREQLLLSTQFLEAAD